MIYMREDKDPIKEMVGGWRMGMKISKYSEDIMNWTQNIILTERRIKMTSKYGWRKINDEVYLGLEKESECFFHVLIFVEQMKKTWRYAAEE